MTGNFAPHGRSLRGGIAAALLSLATAPGFSMAASFTFTLDTHFDQGVLSGVNHDAPNSNQLQLNVVGTTFPVLWIANAGEDTVSKFDTVNNRELARYRTWFGPAGQPGHVNHLNDAFNGPAPSRTAVDIQGNAYVLNRHFESTRTPVLIKILSEGGIDRNGNGVIDTSADGNSDGIIGGVEIKNLADTNGNGIIDDSEIQDERIAWAVRVGANNDLGRSLCIGTDGHLWVGMYNGRRYFKVSSVDGSILAGPVSTGSLTPYGCLIDANGTLWSASLSGLLGKITGTQNSSGFVFSSFNSGRQNYGIALGNNQVYLGDLAGARYQQFNPATNAFTLPGQGAAFAATGISVDGSGNILTGPYLSGGVTKYSPAGAVIWTRPTQFNSETRGVIIDQDNNVWQVSRTGNRLMKYRGSDGAPLGVFPIGNQPYTYSDASGFAARNITTSTGTWNVVVNGGAAGTPWGKISWTESLPAGSSVQVTARAANVQADLPLQPFMPVVNGAQFALAGQFIEVQTRLNAGAGGQSPVLFDLTVASLVTKCDVDADGDIDRADLNLIMAARNQPASGPSDPRDADGDGMITVNDGRACTLRCTRPNCATLQ